MNINGITQTAQVLPESPPAQAPAPQAATTTSSEISSSGADAVSFSTQVQTQVMDMAQRQFEQAASELISSMAASTGVGSNVDYQV